MQSKGLALPRRTPNASLRTNKYHSKSIVFAGSLLNNYNRHNHCRGLASFKLFASSPEQSDPVPESSSSEATQPQEEIVSLSSWADDVSQSPSTTDDWGPTPANARQHGRHPLANTLFALSLGGIAIGAFFLGRKYNAYNQARTTTQASIAQVRELIRDGHYENKDIVPGASTPSSPNKLATEMNTDGAAATAVATTTSGLPRKIIITPTMPKHRESKESIVTDSKKAIDEPEKDDFILVEKQVDTRHGASSEADSAGKVPMEEEEKLPLHPPPSLALTPSVVEKTTVQKEQKELNSEPANDAPSASEEKNLDQKPLVSTIESVSTNEEEEEEDNTKKDNAIETNNNLVIVEEKEKKEKTDEESPPLSKFPLRTAEAEAALERIRAIQRRRQDLYDKAIARQENRLKLTAPSTPAAAAKSVEMTTEIENQGQKTSSVPSGSRYIDEEEFQNNIQEDFSLIEGVEIPKGMSLRELRERAVAANKAAAASATAAHRAATASALAADAADTAIHAAQQASLAAAQCQSALDLRSADAIEEAFRAVTEAEEKAESAAKQAAVSSAKAVVSKRDAEKKAHVATKAAELSAPHGIAAQSSAFWRQLRRDAASVAEKTNENVQSGAAAAGWMWNQGSEKVHNVWKEVQKGLPSGTGTANNEVVVKAEVKQAVVNKKGVVNKNEKKEKEGANSEKKRKGFIFWRSRK